MTKDEALVKRMLEWVDSLRRQSDYGQHMNIPSGLSARTCWELANELELFIQAALEAKAEPVVFNTLASLKHKKTVGPIESAMLNTTPPQRTWVGLTNENVEKMWDFYKPSAFDFYVAIEFELKEKNT